MADKKADPLRRDLLELATGNLAFNKFAANQAGVFTAMATSVANKWGSLPLCMTVDDIRQEMLLAVHMQIPCYDPARGDIKKYIVWHACTAARRQLARQAAQKDRDDTLDRETDIQEPIQEEVTLMLERRDILPIGERQRIVIESLCRTGSLYQTAVSLLADPITRSMFPTPTLKRARHSVYRTGLKLAKRAQTAA